MGAMRDNVRAIVASAIRAEIARKNVDQRTLAQRVGKSQTWLSRVTHGKTSCRVEDLAALAAALDVPVAALLPMDRAA